MGALEDLKRDLEPIIREEAAGTFEGRVNDPGSPTHKTAAVCRQHIAELGLDEVMRVVGEVMEQDGVTWPSGMQKAMFPGSVRGVLERGAY